MTEQKGEQVTKRVEFTAKDDDQQIATGIVMVPNAVDLQRDFVQPDTIQTFAEQFENFEDVGEADGGVMHAVWPSDHISLERNEVLDEPTEIGGTTAPEGAWIQGWEFQDDELWSLVDDGILEGYSIGAINVDWGGPYEQDELDDEIRVPDEIGEDEFVWELVSAIIREVSAVDIPAVPDAMILETKADAEKRLSDHLGNRDGFIEEAQERGHSEGEAERLWEYLNRAVDVEGAGEPGKQSMFTRIGKTVVSALSGSDDGANARTASEDPDRGHDVVPTPNNPNLGKDGASKEGRTLSRQNRESLYATIDASLDVLQDAGVDHGMTRFTDRDDTAFDLSEHSAREWPDPDEDDEPEESAGTDGPPFESASGGDTPDDGGGTNAAQTTDMSDNDPEGEDKSLVEKNAEQIEELTDSVETLTAALTGEEKTREIELGGETVEVSESELKSALGVENSGGEEDVESLKSDIQELAERVDTISTQSGTTDSQQLGKGAGESETEKGSGFTLDPRKARE